MCSSFANLYATHTTNNNITLKNINYVPPGSAIPDNNSDNSLSSLNNILLQDEIDYLLSPFEIYCKSLRCPNCEKKKGIFHRNGSTKSEPSQPIFRCNGYGSSFRAKTILNTVNSTQSTPTNTQAPMNPEFSESSHCQSLYLT